MLDYENFAKIWAKRTDRWTIVKQFITDWHEPLKPSDGYDVELTMAETRLGCALPMAVKEWYALAGRRRDLDAQNPLCRPLELNWTKSRDESNDDLLVLFNENQGCADWSVKRQDITFVDPPVWFFFHDENNTELDKESETFSEFAMAMLVQVTALGCGNFNLYSESDCAIQDAYSSMGLPECRWTRNPGFSFWSGRDSVIMMAPAGLYWIAARTQIACDQAKKFFNAEVIQ